MFRFFDIIFSLIGLILLFPILMLIFIIGLFDTGSPIFIQTRLGKNNRFFNLFKFRTMSLNTKNVATHLVPKNNVTKLVNFLGRQN